MFWNKKKKIVNQQAQEEVTEVCRIIEITAGPDGAYLHIEIPISFDAFCLIEHKLSKQGFYLRSVGGSGSKSISSPVSSWKLGPFATVEEAKESLDKITTEVLAIHDNEVNLIKEFSVLKGQVYIVNKTRSQQ